MLRLRHYLRAQNRAHHTIDRLEKRGVERGSSRRSSLKGRERAIVNQTNTETVSKFELNCCHSAASCGVMCLPRHSGSNNQETQVEVDQADVTDSDLRYVTAR